MGWKVKNVLIDADLVFVYLKEDVEFIDLGRWIWYHYYLGKSLYGSIQTDDWCLWWVDLVGCSIFYKSYAILSLHSDLLTPISIIISLTFSLLLSYFFKLSLSFLSLSFSFYPKLYFNLDSSLFLSISTPRWGFALSLCIFCSIIYFLYWLYFTFFESIFICSNKAFVITLLTLRVFFCLFFD